MNQKRKESFVLLGITFLFFVSFFLFLSGRERTSKLYAYNELHKPEKQQVAQSNPEQKQEDKHQEKDQKKKNQDEESDKNNNSDQDSDSSEGNGTNVKNPKGNGTGDGEEGENTEDPTNESEPTENEAYPTPSAAPTEVPTPGPKDENLPVSIACSWGDKDDLLYGKPISKDNIKVTVEYTDGTKKEVSGSDCIFRGLNNDSLGKHTATVEYEGVSCRVSYTINNYVVGITYSWPTKDECYTGEYIDSEVLTVYSKMADGSKSVLSEKKYKLTGINEQLDGEKQEFKIKYEDFTVTGTCHFYRRMIRFKCIYYNDNEMSDEVANLDYYVGDYDLFVGEKLSLHNFTTKSEDLYEYDDDRSYKGKKYTLKELVVKVDDKEQKLPYTVKERFFEPIHVIKKYVKN